MALWQDLTRCYRFRPAEAKLAAALYAADGAVSAYELAEAVVDDDALAEGSNALKVHICNVRAKLSRDSIETIQAEPDGCTPGKRPVVGYRLTDEGRALIWTALRVSEAA